LFFFDSQCINTLMYIYIQTTGYGPASAQIQVYSDRTTGWAQTAGTKWVDLTVYRDVP